MNSIKQNLQETSQIIQSTIKSQLDSESCRLSKAILYSCIPAGKCIRGFLTLEFCKSFNMQKQDSLLLASAVELIHAFSLVHDDLPALDNSQYRRGRKSCHAEFSESTAILAGDAILAIAYLILGKNFPSTVQIASECVLEMIKGQSIELEEQDSKWLDISKMKTGAIFALSCALGPIVLCASLQEIKIIKEFGYSFGVLYQLIDDIKDKDTVLPDNLNQNTIIAELKTLLENQVFLKNKSNLENLIEYILSSN